MRGKTMTRHKGITKMLYKLTCACLRVKTSETKRCVVLTYSGGGKSCKLKKMTMHD